MSGELNKSGGSQGVGFFEDHRQYDGSVEGGRLSDKRPVGASGASKIGSSGEEARDLPASVPSMAWKTPVNRAPALPARHTVPARRQSAAQFRT